MKAGYTIFMLVVSILFVANLAVAQTKFCESNGIVSMEAENANKSSWKQVSGNSGAAMEDVGGSMEYEITFTSTGNFYVFFLCRYTGTDWTAANDAYVTLGGQKLYGSDDVTRPDGIRVHCNNFCWSSLPKGPGGHTPELIKPGPVYAKVSTTGKHVFKISSRSKGFVVDKIVLKLADSSYPTGTGPSETMCGGTPPPPPGNSTIIEAEDMTLDGTYMVDNGTQLGGTGIVVDPTLTAPATGTATTTFTGTNGSYTIRLSVIPEQDGAPTVKVFVGTTQIINEVYPVDPGYFTLAARIDYEATGVTLNSGDVIKIEGTSEALAFARVDKLELIEESTATSIAYSALKNFQEAVQLYPYPMTDKTMFIFDDLNERASGIAIYDNVGTHIKTIHPTSDGVGYEWNGKDETGVAAQPGIYFYGISINGIQQSGSIIKVE